MNWIDATASAVGEMIYNLCKALGVTPTKEIATRMYTALLTDTGSFQFSKMTERTFKIASEARAARARAGDGVAGSVLLVSLWKDQVAWSRAFSTLEHDESGQIAWTV